MEYYCKVLIVWYNHNKRDLPWRNSKDAYKIWVSEIILQQTRVQQGLDYYHRFLDRFPDINSLAKAPEEDVLKVWQGLGYYSRARNMHHAAKAVTREYGGRFPADYASIRKLKGIGDYTAAAIASVSFDLPFAVVDGNVYRVLSRLFGISTPIDSAKGKKEFAELAQSILEVNQPGESNQALMEFGAIQCVPGQPDCSVCPLSHKCFACLNRSVSAFPVKTKKVKQKERYLNYLYICDNDHLFLEKRGDGDIWRNMYQLPLIETKNPATAEELIRSEEWKEVFNNGAPMIGPVFPERIHLLTHQRLHIRFISVRLHGTLPQERYTKVGRNDIERYPVPKPVETFLLEMGH